MARRKKNNKKGKKHFQAKQREQESSEARAEKKPRSHLLRNTAILFACSLIVLSACVVMINHPSGPQSTPDSRDSDLPKAAILDGLYDPAPNATFADTLMQYLSSAGYAVDVYRGANVTIDLLRSIGGYEILILRLHSSIHTDGFLYVFSGEKYTESKYVDEQLERAVRKAYTFNESEPPYFALNSVFVGQKNPNGLDGTTLVMMGCNGTANPYVIQRFFQNGVSTYISWDGYVTLPHSDEATLRLVKAIYSEGLTPEVAVEKINGEVGPDPFYNSKLICALP